MADLFDPNAETSDLVSLTDDEIEDLRDWWDAETTESVESVFALVDAIIARHVARSLRAAGESMPLGYSHAAHILRDFAERIVVPD